VAGSTLKLNVIPLSWRSARLSIEAFSSASVRRISIAMITPR
jgi:hypothetical protein